MMRLTSTGFTLGFALAIAISRPAVAQRDSTASIRADTAQSITAARKAAEAWLTLLDGGDYGTSWDSSAAAFRRAVSRGDWETAVVGARAPFEPFTSRTLAASQYRRDLPGAPPGEYVMLQYQAAVSGGRTALETVVPMKEADGSWRVSGYFVKPQ